MPSAVAFAIVAGSGYLLLFRLPFAFPGKERLTSASYAFGFNNQVAIAALICLTGLLTIFRLWRTGTVPAISFVSAVTDRLPRRALAIMSFVYLAFTWAVYQWAKSVPWYGIDWESSHFIWRLKLTVLYGLRPYSDYQYEYGPALAYFPIVLAKLLSGTGISLEAVYYVSHLFLNVCGLFSLALILDHLSIPIRNKKMIFFVLAFAAYLPNMGLNGVLLRYVTVPLGMILVHQALRAARRIFEFRVFFVSLIACATNIAISPEMGIAFLLTLGCYSTARIRRTRGVISALLALGLSAILAPLLLPVPYYATLLHFGQGANNLPLLLSSPHLVLYLIAFLWIVPICLAGWWNKHEDKVLVAALSFSCLLLMPGALGRCDPYHVMFYGLGLFLLAFAHMANSNPLYFRYAALGYVLVFVLGLEIINFWVFGLTPRAIVHWVRAPSPAPAHPEELRKYAAFALPYGSYGYTKQMQQWLWASRKVAPEYYMGGMGIYTESQMADRLRDIGRFRYALVPDWYYNLDQFAGDPCVWQWQSMRKVLLSPSPLSCKQKAIIPDVEIARFLKLKYRIIDKVDEYIVLERTYRLVSTNPEPDLSATRHPNLNN